MLIKDVISGLSTLGKAVKFLKKQDEIKNKTVTLIDEVKGVLDFFKKYVTEIETVIENLKGVLNK